MYRLNYMVMDIFEYNAKNRATRTKRKIMKTEAVAHTQNYHLDLDGKYFVDWNVGFAHIVELPCQSWDMFLFYQRWCCRGCAKECRMKISTMLLAIMDGFFLV